MKVRRRVVRKKKNKKEFLWLDMESPYAEYLPARY